MYDHMVINTAGISYNNNNDDDDDDMMIVKEMNEGEEPSIFERLLTVCSKLCLASMCKHF